MTFMPWMVHAQVRDSSASQPQSENREHRPICSSKTFTTIVDQPLEKEVLPPVVLPCQLCSTADAFPHLLHATQASVLSHLVRPSVTHPDSASQAAMYPLWHSQ